MGPSLATLLSPGSATSSNNRTCSLELMPLAIPEAISIDRGNFQPLCLLERLSTMYTRLPRLVDVLQKPHPSVCSNCIFRDLHSDFQSHTQLDHVFQRNGPCLRVVV